MKAGVKSPLAQAIVDQNRASRVDGLRAALGVLALLATLSLFFTGGAPQRQPGVADPGLSADAVAAAGGGDD